MAGGIASPKMVQEPEMKEPERKEAPQIVMDGVITPSEVPLKAKVPLLDHGALKELGLSSGEWGKSLVVVGEEGKNAAWGLVTALTSFLTLGTKNCIAPGQEELQQPFCAKLRFPGKLKSTGHFRVKPFAKYIELAASFMVLSGLSFSTLMLEHIVVCRGSQDV